MVEQDDIGCSQANPSSVSLMTIHKSKGLEFPFVFVVETAEPWYRLDRYWAKSSRGLSLLELPHDRPIANNIFQSKINVWKEHLYHESQRLLYVSLTRASQYLMVSGNIQKSEKAESFYQFLQPLWKKKKLNYLIQAALNLKVHQKL